MKSHTAAAEAGTVALTPHIVVVAARLNMETALVGTLMSVGRRRSLPHLIIRSAEDAIISIARSTCSELGTLPSLWGRTLRKLLKREA